MPFATKVDNRYITQHYNLIYRKWHWIQSLCLWIYLVLFSCGWYRGLPILNPDLFLLINSVREKSLKNRLRTSCFPRYAVLCISCVRISYQTTKKTYLLTVEHHSCMVCAATSQRELSSESIGTLHSTFSCISFSWIRQGASVHE